MKSLNAQELQELRTALQQREAQLLAQLRDGRKRAAGEPFARLASEVPDPGDASVADAAVDTASAERERDASELRDIRDALQRMESGIYGVCEECGKPIPLERLRASPTARYDIAHQRDRESGKVSTPRL